MGNSPLSVCIHQVWEKQTVQVVLPDGQVLFMPHPMTVAKLLESHPFHFVCQGSPSVLEQRLPADTKLETGEIYYLLPVPPAVISAPSSFERRLVRPKSRKPEEKVVYDPQLLDKSDSTFTEYAQVNLKPQRCLINFFVFRQSVASVMPEETLKPQGDQCGSRPPARKYPRFESRYRGVRGRKQVISWTPHLESISETKPVQEFSKNCVNDISVSMFSSIKSLAAPDPEPVLEHGQQLALIHVPLHGERESQRHKFIYSA